MIKDDPSAKSLVLVDAKVELNSGLQDEIGGARGGGGGGGGGEGRGGMRRGKQVNKD